MEEKRRWANRKGLGMKKYTDKDLESFERDQYGFLICPSGDYTGIRCFGESCSFGVRCSFGKCCSFGELCSFGDFCSFGDRCSFGEGCSFGDLCSFGEGCIFGECCRFGKFCSFGERCSFGEGCSFGKFCSFGERCSFGEGCKYLDFDFNRLINLNGLFEYAIRIYLNEDNYYLSIGCESFVSMDDAKECGEARGCYDPDVHNIVERIIKKALKG